MQCRCQKDFFQLWFFHKTLFWPVWLLDLLFSAHFYSQRKFQFQRISLHELQARKSTTKFVNDTSDILSTINYCWTFLIVCHCMQTLSLRLNYGEIETERSLHSYCKSKHFQRYFWTFYFNLKSIEGYQICSPVKEPSLCEVFKPSSTSCLLGIKALNILKQIKQ